jgi:hypothetical protein
MNKTLLMLILLFVLGILFFSCGVFLGDLVGIGGYDHFAPESLYNAFQHGRFSGTVWYSIAEYSSMVSLFLGVSSIFISLIALIVVTIKKAFWLIKINL